MNGEYIITPTSNASGKMRPGQYSTDWNQYPGGVEYFETYVGPITSLYSQVWWKATKSHRSLHNLSQIPHVLSTRQRNANLYTHMHIRKRPTVL